MLGGAFVDLYMTKGHMREPHWHPNAWELDVVVSGEVQVSILDPDTSSMHNYRIKEGEVVLYRWAGGIGSNRYRKKRICISF